VHDLKKDLKEEVKEAKEKALQDIQSHIAKQKEEVTEGKTKALQEVQLYINKQIAEQFSAQNIKQTLETVAATEAKEIINKQIGPVIDESKYAIITLEDKLRQDVGKIRTDFHTELQDLRKEVDFQKKLREIQRLQYKAIRQCDLKAYETLPNYERESADLKLAASASILAIQSYFLSNRRYYLETTEKMYKSLAKKFEDNHAFHLLFKHNEEHNIYRTDSLLGLLDSDRKLLGSDNIGLIDELIMHLFYNRKECGVLEALLKAMSSHESLCVRYAALASFASITDYPSLDILGFKHAQEWYNENRSKVRKDVGCQDEKP
jgi:hypothetical protein